MKEISSSHIIDQAIKKLESIKNGQSDRSIIEELYAVRAYCDLLLTTFEKEEKRPITSPTQIIEKKQASKLLEDEDDYSIFDF